MSRLLVGRVARRLDRWAIPRLAAALRQGRVGVRRAGAATGPPGRWVRRFARRQPAVVAAVAMVAIAAGLFGVTGGDVGRGVAPGPQRPAPSVAPANQLGPVAGRSVSGYLASVSERLGGLQNQPAALRTTAVVDFTGYLTADAVRSLLAGVAGVRVSRAFAQAPPPAVAKVHTLTIGSIVALPGALAAARSDAATFLRAYHRVARLAAAHPSTRRAALVASYASQAQQARVDARGLGPGRGCVFAVVVDAPVGAIERLASRPAVRAVDPASPGTSVSDLLIVPLEPEAIGTVTPLGFVSQ